VAVSELVNKRELAKAMAVSEPTIESWLDLGMPVVSKGSNGVAYEFDLDAVRSWKASRDQASRDEVERRQNELFGDGIRLAPDGDVRQLRERAALETDIMVLSAKRRELIPRKEVEDDYAAVFGLIRQHLLSLDAALTKSAGLTHAQQQEHRRLIRIVMDSLARAISHPDLRPPVTELFDAAA
jgi:hypothetical protein